MLDDLTQVADARVDPSARTDLLDRLNLIRTSEDRPDLAALATRLRPYVASTPAEVPGGRSRWQRFASSCARVERRLLPRPVHRLLLAFISLLLGLYSLIGLVIVIALTTDAAHTVIKLDDRNIRAPEEKPLLIVAGIGETFVGLLLVAAALLLFFFRDRRGVQAGIRGLVLALAVVNVVLGYISAELVVFAIVVELLLLGLFVRFRTRFVVPTPAAATSAAPVPVPED